MFGINVCLPTSPPPRSLFLKLVDIKDTPAYSEVQSTFLGLPISLLCMRLPKKFEAWHICVMPLRQLL